MPNSQFTAVDPTWIVAGTTKANTFTAAQTFSVSATFSAGLTSTGLAQFSSSSLTVGGIVTRANGAISANPAGYANCAFQSVGAQATTANNMFDSAGGVVQLVLRRRNGTYSAQTAVLNNETIGQLDWQGHDGTTVRTQAQIQGFAIENFTSTANGTALSFATTAAGTTTLATRLTLTSTFANFVVPVYANSLFLVNDVSGTTRAFRIDTNLSRRWQIIGNNIGETGSNVGTNLEIRRYSDAAVDLGLVMTVTRSTGDITFNGGGGITTFANGLNTNEARVDRPAGNNRFLFFRSGGLNRWAVYAGSGAESGSNAGSDFGIERYNDAGAFLGLVMFANRANGNITFNGGGGTTTFSANQIAISTSQTPASATATGTAGTICWDANYIYVCTATDTWKRVAIATW
jgi:hypothetical protein